MGCLNPHGFQLFQDETASCTNCSLSRRRDRVIQGHGSKEARLLVLTGGPTKEDSALGKLLLGAAGEVLSIALEEGGLSKDQVWISSATACPSWNATGKSTQAPTAVQGAACLPRLQQEVYFIDPTFILTLGPVAKQSLVGASNQKMGTAAGKLFRMDIPGRHIKKVSYPALATWHPDYLLKTKMLRYDPRKKPQLTAYKAGEEWLDHVRHAIRLSLMPRSFS
jgi:DNA polymerase